MQCEPIDEPIQEVDQLAHSSLERPIKSTGFQLSKTMQPIPPSNGAAYTLDDALAWLAQPVNPDPLGDLVTLRRALHALSRAELPPAHRFRIVVVFAPRLRTAYEAIQEILTNSPLPLLQSMATVTKAMMDIHGQVAEILLDAAIGSGGPAEYTWRSNSQIFSTILVELQRRLTLSLISFGQVPANVWAHAVTTLACLRSDLTTPVPGQLGQMLALSALQPESFTPREINYLRTVLNLFDEPVDLLDTLPSDALPFFWLNPERDAPPVASTRQSPPASSRLVYFRFTSLLRALDPVLEQLESGTPARQLGMPSESNQLDYLNVLQRTRQTLANPAHRQFPRRKHQDVAKVCVRLSELWGLLQQEEGAGKVISGWTVVNKSPDGCALTHVTGDISGLMAGGALGMRESEFAPWSVCLIRWVRGGVAEKIELGLEFLAPHAIPVRIVSGDASSETLPGLLLPALPKLDRKESLLVGRGRRWGQEFGMLIETGGKTMLASCRPSTLVQQTSSVEVFEFERIRSPG